MVKKSRLQISASWYRLVRIWILLVNSMQLIITMLSKEEALTLGRELGINDYIAQMNLFRVLLNHPKIAKELNSTIIALVSSENASDEKLLTDRQRELIIMRTAWLVHCEYEWSQHWLASLFFGLAENELAAIRDWQQASCFDEAERALLSATDGVLSNGKIPADTLAQIRQYFPGDKALIEIVTCIGNWHMFGLLLNALEIPLDEGMVSWPPDGRAPSNLINEEK